MYMNCNKNPVSSWKFDFFLFSKMLCNHSSSRQGFFFFSIYEISDDHWHYDFEIFFHLRQILKFILIFLWIKNNNCNIPLHHNLVHFLRCFMSCLFPYSFGQEEMYISAIKNPFYYYNVNSICSSSNDITITYPAGNREGNFSITGTTVEQVDATKICVPIIVKIFVCADIGRERKGMFQ